jgi:glyceraldehyde 3-phosphate dehydrogenase
MTYRVAINGFGRIGRSYVRCVLERGLHEQGIEIVAINDLWDSATLAHLLQYDTTFGKLGFPVEVADDKIKVGGVTLTALRQKDPSALPWADLGVDLVIESTGKLRGRDDCVAHLKAGAKKVIISAPGKNVDGTFVMGVNDADYDPAKHEIISCASCTTNCVAPMVKVLNDSFGLVRGFLTTIHAYTNDQLVLDAPHKDLRRARSAAVNIIPTSTGAAKAVGLVLPDLAGRLDGVALRVPVEDGSMSDLAVELAKPATAAEINEAMKAAAEGPLAGILRYATSPLVSRDIVADPASCIFDSGLTQASGTMAKVFGWYDNEWGYTNRLVDLSLKVAKG